jgi:predicted chitinase
MRAKDFILFEANQRPTFDPIGSLIDKLSPDSKAKPPQPPAKKPSGPVKPADSLSNGEELITKPKKPAVTPPKQVALEPKGLGAYIESRARADGITGVQLANFMAQSRVETAGFTTLEERADGSAYEGRKGIGNIYKGDGPKFKGRGFLQLTGRDNYTKCAAAIGVDIVKTPEVVATNKKVAADSALWFWNTFIRPNYRPHDIRGVSVRVNGGTNGLTERIAAFQSYIAKLKKAVPSRLKDKEVSTDMTGDADQYVASVDMPDELAEEGKASRALCTGGKPDHELGASQLASCKSQGLRARDGEKSHLITAGKRNVRVTVGGKKIKGRKYGGPLPDYGTRKNQK